MAESQQFEHGEEDTSRIKQILMEFRATPRLRRQEDLLHYWERRKISDPELYLLAIIVNAVPMTQVSVERLFSAMKFIYSDLRANLDPQLTEDILLIRCNGFFKTEQSKRAKKSNNANKKKAQNNNQESEKTTASTSTADSSASTSTN